MMQVCPLPTLTPAAVKCDIAVSDAREWLQAQPDGSAHCCVTSPPYGPQRDYGQAGQIGYGQTLDQYIDSLLGVFMELHRVLRSDGTFWLNLGDVYVKKQLQGIPWLVALSLRQRGWFLRQSIIWHKSNSMAHPNYDRCVSSHEYIFLLTKQPRYYFDYVAIQQPMAESSKARYKYEFGGKKNKGLIEAEKTGAGCRTRVVGDRQSTGMSNCRDVWKMSVARFKGAHTAVFPPSLPERCIKAGTSEKGCCVECGKQLVRGVVKTRVPTRPGKDTKLTELGTDPTKVGNRDPERHVTTVETVGWSFACYHADCEGPANTEPATVIDPFLGSGTTAMVANKLGRSFKGCDLNPANVEMAYERVRLGK